MKEEVTKPEGRIRCPSSSNYMRVSLSSSWWRWFCCFVRRRLSQYSVENLLYPGRRSSKKGLDALLNGFPYSVNFVRDRFRGGEDGGKVGDSLVHSCRDVLEGCLHCRRKTCSRRLRNEEGHRRQSNFTCQTLRYIPELYGAPAT